MKYNSFETFLYGKEYPIVKWLDEERIDLWIEQIIDNQKCPNCGKECNKVHDIHTRVIQDTPIHNKNVYILDEFIGSGYTLRIIIDAVHKKGGRVNGIGVIATIDDNIEYLSSHPYNMIPIRTLTGSIGKK